MNDNEIQTFLLIAKQPQSERLKQWGYKSTKHKGVYQSQYHFFDQITLISLADQLAGLNQKELDEIEHLISLKRNQNRNSDPK